MLPKTLAFVAFFFGTAVAQQSPPTPGCHALCCGSLLDPNSAALKLILGKGTLLPPGDFGLNCNLGNCTVIDVGKKDSCCLYYAQYLKFGGVCSTAA